MLPTVRGLRCSNAAIKTMFYFSFHFYIIFFVLICYNFDFCATDDVGKLPHCIETTKEKTGIVLVSTLDGQVTALDNNGKIKWQLTTGPGALIKSNIHTLELTNNGKWIRMIPSLSGCLYKFDGSTVDAIPITVENLLTSSFKYTDDLVFAGGREVRKYGLSLNSGKEAYECTLDGCINKNNGQEDDNIIVIERNTQAVRAIEPRSGTERWNFSVGYHTIKVPQSSCLPDQPKLNLDVTAVLPDGLLIAHKLNKQSEVLWKHKFSAPIVSVWLWDGRNLSPVDLFSSAPKYLSNNNEPLPSSPSLYIGMHEKQLYIHESINMRNTLHVYHNSGSSIQTLPSIPWKPVSAGINDASPVDDTTALSVLYSSEYVNGNGYYLYTSADDTKDNVIVCDNITISEEETPSPPPPITEYTIVSIGYWWRELIVLSITTAIMLNLMFSFNNNLFGTRRQPVQTQPEIIVVEHHVEKPVSAALPQREERIVSESSKFFSRYLTDFTPIKCLGQGGFGLVFEAKNNLDECLYAVKRITLPQKKEARERVIREVKALAKLEHPNIVRYFNAWFESPPPGWQEQHDLLWKKDQKWPFPSGATDMSTTNPSKQSHVIDVSKAADALDLNVDAAKHLDENTDSFIVFRNESLDDEESSSTCGQNTSPSTINSTGKSQTKHESIKTLWKFRNQRSRSLDITNKGQIVNVSPRQQHFLYIQMQLCRSDCLRDWLNENKERPKLLIKNIFQQIVSAVEYVHLQGLIHRDLKPSNIFFAMDGQVKIGDFGLATTGWDEGYSQPDSSTSPVFSRSHTRAVGTCLYMSPEQTNGLRYNYKVDIYSLGVILFELLVSFSTEMERITTLTNLRNYLYPDNFHLQFQTEFSLLNLMLAQNPNKRPTAKSIIESWLSKEGVISNIH